MESDDSLNSKIFICTVDQSAPNNVAKRRRKPKVSSSWTYSGIHDLILAIKQHPCVWEYSSPEYKDRHKREQAWCKIQKRCPRHTVDDCKAKWANVKTAFQNVKKKMQAKSGQGSKNIEPHWPYWRAMQFCNRHNTSKGVPSVPVQEVKKAPVGYSISETCSLAKTATSSFPETFSLDRSSILQRKVKCQELEKDNWHAIGMYLASQLREIAKKNKKAANRLHLQLVQSVMEVTLELEDDKDI